MVMGESKIGNQLLRGSLALWMALTPTMDAFAGADQTTTATASGTVATVFSISVSGNINFVTIPYDATYTAEQTNTVTATNNEDVAWYVKARINTAVTGATLEAKGADVVLFQALTTTNQTYKSVIVTPKNTPNGAAATYTLTQTV